MKTTGPQHHSKTLLPMGETVLSPRPLGYALSSHKLHPPPPIKQAGQWPHYHYCPRSFAWASPTSWLSPPLPPILPISRFHQFSQVPLSNSAPGMFFKTILTLLFTPWPWIPLHLNVCLFLCFVCGQSRCVSENVWCRAVHMGSCLMNECVQICMTWTPNMFHVNIHIIQLCIYL